MVRRGASILIGLLLLAAAGLKVYGLNVQPVAQHSILFHPTVQFAAVEWEIVLGAWLLSGRWPTEAWAAAVVTFLIFGGVSLHLGLTGQALCGCFGSVEASPWHAFAVDVAALALLAVRRPDFRALSQKGLCREVIVKPLGVAAGAAGLCAVLVGGHRSRSARLKRRWPGCAARQWRFVRAR